MVATPVETAQMIRVALSLLSIRNLQHYGSSFWVLVRPSVLECDQRSYDSK